MGASKRGRRRAAWLSGFAAALLAATAGVTLAQGVAAALGTAAGPPVRFKLPPFPPRPFQLISLDPAFDDLIAPGTELTTVATLPPVGISEGVMWRQGKVWVCDQRGGIYAVAPDGSWGMVVEKDAWPIAPDRLENAGPGGQAAWKDGATLMTRQGPRDIGLRDRDGRITAFASAYDGKKLNSPNDLTVARDDAVWFTDPPFGVEGFFRPNGRPVDKPLDFNGVFRVKDGKVSAMITDMVRPNGIVFSPDGKTLYVSGSAPAEVRAYDVGRDGALGKARVFASFPADTPFGRGQPDGMKVDAKGDLWLIGAGGLLVYNPAGKLLGRVQLPMMGTNITFGDADYRSVYISTYGDKLYRLRTKVKGQLPKYTQL